MSDPLKRIEAIWMVFRRNVERDRGIILQSNTRAGAVAQFIAAVISGAGIVVAVILPRPNVRFTELAGWYGLFAIMMFVAMVVSLVVILWPRKLSNLPKDSSVETYRARIATEADAAMESKMPTNAEYWEAYLLQGIGRVKERATQVGLAATMTFVVFFFLAIASLKY